MNFENFQNTFSCSSYSDLKYGFCWHIKKNIGQIDLAPALDTNDDDNNAFDNKKTLIILIDIHFLNQFSGSGDLKTDISVLFSK